MRFNLRLMLVAVAVVAVVSAGLASPGLWWASALATALTFWLFASLALAVGGRGRARVFWAAVFLSGTAYCYSLAPTWGGGVTLNSNVAFGFDSNGLLTTKLLGAAFDSLHRASVNAMPVPVAAPMAAPVAAPYYQPADAAGPFYAPPIVATGSVVPAPVVASQPVYRIRRECFLTAGHAFFGLLTSLAGGALATGAYDRRPTGRSDPANMTAD